MRKVFTLAAVCLVLAISSVSAQQKAPQPQPTPQPQARPSTTDSADPRVDLDRCAQLRDEHIKVLQSGIVQDMQRGPEWAKFHLSKERLGEIEKYIALEEQLKFTCREANLLIDPKSLFPPAVPANAAGGGTAAAAAEGQPRPKKTQKKKQKTPDSNGSGVDLVWPGLAP